MSSDAPELSELSDPCPEKTRSDLEWDRVLTAVAERCASEIGKAAALALPFCETRARVRQAAAEGRDALALRQAGEAIPVSGLPAIDHALDRLRIGAVLAPEELRAMAQLLAWAKSARRFLSARQERAAALYAACATDPTLDDVGEEVQSSFDAAGTLADHASPRLKELRQEQRAARARMMARLADLMQRYAELLQDQYVTEREGRFVIPVRADAHLRFPGIVHSTSGSGGTLFVEPRAVVPMGNRLKVLEGEVAREEERIYAHLSARLCAHLPSVLGAAEAMARLDVCAAVAHLADEQRLHYATIVDAPRMKLERARHLLLGLSMPGVVASDLSVDPSHAVVLSGPNAGGKTVALKTLGLAALLVRAGLPLPCEEGSEAGIFHVVLSDVGDDQSLQKSLSTFSAHVQNVAAILARAHKGSLVLLDELAGGTDPREGEALAAGVLDALVTQGAAVIATTHYEGLKTLALQDDRFANACVGFDLATMMPTFRVTMGVAGASSALAVARRYGIPDEVVGRAERFLSPEVRGLDEELRRAHEQRVAAELMRESVERERSQAETLRRSLEEELARARTRERRELSEEAARLAASLLRAKEELRSAQAKLRARRPDDAQLRDAQRSLDRASSGIAIGGELEPLLVRSAPAREPASDFRPGARVHVSRLRLDGEVLEVLDENHVRVAAGPLKVVVSKEELRVPDARDEKRKPRSAPRERPRATEPAIQTAENSCDLRGMRVDEAIGSATRFLDRSMREGLRVVFLIHGHGTGALRDAVRKEVEASGYAAQMRPGETGEGGDGVTIVWLV
ncbi:MAG TPA: Smr/MutS family protein [Polyangiaceae bacterium]|jgi:DNA mismatch repair protein MutS2